MAYKRRIYIINPKFQIRFSLLISLLVFLSSLIYPFAIYDLMSSLIEKSAGENAAELEHQRTNLLIILSLWQIGFTALVFIICIFFSHKVAGPLYKLSKFLTAIRDGRAHGTLFFRKGDYFQELADEFNETVGRLEEEHKKDFVYLAEVSAYINNLSLVVPEDKKIVLKEITEKLSEIQNRFHS